MPKKIELRIYWEYQLRYSQRVQKQPSKRDVNKDYNPSINTLWENPSRLMIGCNRIPLAKYRPISKIG